MSFLQPFLLYGLPLAMLPVIIHLIHLHRRRTVPWAAMMFLRMAQRMSKGYSRLRQVLILAFRVLAVAALIFVIGRPLAGGWLGLTGGVPDTALILLDRSASMEQQNELTGTSKRLSGLIKLADSMQQTYRGGTRVVLLDSATLKPLEVENLSKLTDMPQTSATDTSADIPALLQGALDYITTHQTGRTDVWLLSDLQQSDWRSADGRWETMRGAFASLPGVRFHLLTYPQEAPENLSIQVERVARRETVDKTELLLDVRITRQSEQPQPLELPLRVEVNGVASTIQTTLKDNQMLIQGQSVPIDKSLKRGWGRVELPSDAFPSDNVFYFVFDDPAPLKTVIVTDRPEETLPIQAALRAQADPSRKYEVVTLPPARAVEILWEETALIVWQAPLPTAEDLTGKQLIHHHESGRSLLFLPPDAPTNTALFGLSWGQWKGTAGDKAEKAGWWRNDAGLLASTRDGTALPVGDLEITRHCGIVGQGIPLARLDSQEPLLVRAESSSQGHAYFLGTLPGSGSSSLARDGVVMFALLHRALDEGAATLGNTQQRYAAMDTLGNDAVLGWRAVAGQSPEATADGLALHAGIVQKEERLTALNRSATEDSPSRLGSGHLAELFAGLDFRQIEDSVENDSGLTSEIWRTFLMVMGALLLGEALLCLPGRKNETAASANETKRAGFEPVEG